MKTKNTLIHIGMLAAALLLPLAARAQTLGTTNLVEGPAAGSDSVVLQAGGSWTASTNAVWLHLTAANQSGTGSTNVVFSFDTNSGATRTGTLTIAGQAVTVTQAGVNYVAANPVTTLASTGLSNPYGLAVDTAGNVYIADVNDSALKKWSPTNGAVTTLVSSGLNRPQGVAVDSAGKVYIADARDPARPEIISSIKVGDDGAFAVFPLGNYAYVGGCNPGRSIRIIDISDKRNPKLASSLVDSARYGCICSFRTWGGHYLVAGGWTSRSVSMLDIANPGKPVEAGYLSSDLIDMPNRLTVIGNKAYLINSSNNTLAQVDISNPEKPALDWLVPSWKLKKVYGVASGNGLLYIVGRESMFFLVVNPSKY